MFTTILLIIVGIIYIGLFGFIIIMICYNCGLLCYVSGCCGLCSKLRSLFKKKEVEPEEPIQKIEDKFEEPNQKKEVKTEGPIQNLEV